MISSAYATKDSAVYFPSNNQSYSFIDTPDAEYADVEIKLNIIGPMTDYDRPVAVEVNEETTTATAGQYTVLGGLVKAGATSGTVTVRVNNDKQALAQAIWHWDCGCSATTSSRRTSTRKPTCPSRAELSSRPKPC